MMVEDDRAFFNRVAGEWDDTRAVDAAKLKLLINMSGVAEGDLVLDVGCGTGVIIPLLVNAVGEGGHVTAVDFAEEMVVRAAEKYRRFTNVKFVAEDILKYEGNEGIDVVVCLNVFPHLVDKLGFVIRIRGFLRVGGVLAIMHDRSRTEVNAIHAETKQVKKHKLPAAKEVAGLLSDAGFRIMAVIDDADIYFVKAVRQG